jgi:hypothetical protein
MTESNATAREGYRPYFSNVRSNFYQKEIRQFY